MKILKKLLCCILVTLISVIGCVFSQGAENIVFSPVPVTEKNVSPKWIKKMGTNYRNSPSVPAVDGEYVYVMSGNLLYKLNKDDGSVALTEKMSGTPGYGYVPVTVSDNVVYCPVDGGITEAFYCDTLQKKWTYTDNFGGQSLSPIICDENHVYTGYWNDDTDKADYVCLNSSTGELVWKIEHDGGFYWSGCAVSDKYIILGGEDGMADDDGENTLFCINKYNGEIADSADINGDVRASVVYDDESDSFYFTTKGGFLYSVKMINGKFTSVSKLNLGGSSTSTPVIYGGRIYVGVQNSGTIGGNVVVADVSSMSVIYSVRMKGYPQSSVLIYPDCDDKVYVLSTYNAYPGGIEMFIDSPTRTSSEAYDLYVPENGTTGYCISSLVSDEDGTIYYKNDSGNIFALENNAVAPIRAVFSLIYEKLKIIADFFSRIAITV